MNLDKPLEDMISDKRKSIPTRGPRLSRERAPATPYVRPPPRSTEEKWVHDVYQTPKGAARSAGAAIANVAGTGAAFTGVSSRIEVVGLHYEVTPADLKNIFSQAGTLVQGPDIRLMLSKASDQYDRSGRSRGEATMEYASYQQAKIAINKFDGAMTKGQTISIRLLPPIMVSARPNALGGGGMTGGSLLSRISGGAQSAASPRGSRGGTFRGGAMRGRGAPVGRGRRAPASQGDLDKELDRFMKPDARSVGDVEMA